jgi:hypothetical protein
VLVGPAQAAGSLGPFRRAACDPGATSSHLTMHIDGGAAGAMFSPQARTKRAQPWALSGNKDRSHRQRLATSSLPTLSPSDCFLPNRDAGDDWPRAGRDRHEVGTRREGHAGVLRARR